MRNGCTDGASGVAAAGMPVFQTYFRTLAVLHRTVWVFAVLQVTPQYSELGAVWCDWARTKGCPAVTSMSQEKDALLLLNNLQIVFCLGKKKTISCCILSRP